MESAGLNIKLLTSSRADYSIYFPLLKLLKKEAKHQVEIVAFGTHLSAHFGNTIKFIKEDDLFPIIEIETQLSSTSAYSVASGIGLVALKFAEFWHQTALQTNLIICLGDRFEMFAAVSTSLPFNIPIAHIHGGETTLGAIDESFRIALSAMSKYHFTSTENYANRVSQIINSEKNIYNTGALAVDTIKEFVPLNDFEFEKQFNFKLNHPVLCTFHPVTGLKDNGIAEVKELLSSLDKLNQQILITMPNADTLGDEIRSLWFAFKENKSNVILVETLGLKGYYTAMTACDFVIGNSSSGIIEAASFGKYVINIGDRQKGRDTGENVIHCLAITEYIDENIRKIKSLPPLNKLNIYGNGNAAVKIVDVINSISL